MSEDSGRRSAWKILAVLFAIVAAAVVVTNETVPQGNASPGPVDALLVLGVPARTDGTPTREETWRVDEAVREFKAGRAPHVVFSGGAAYNRFAEADVMAALAIRLGIPASAVFRERQSRTTMENLAYSQAIFDAHGWRTVEVISAPDHLRRVSVMLANTPMVWRIHAAPTPGRSVWSTMFAYTREAAGTAILRWFGPRAERFLHTVALVTRRHPSDR